MSNVQKLNMPMLNITMSLGAIKDFTYVYANNAVFRRDHFPSSRPRDTLARRYGNRTCTKTSNVSILIYE